MSQYDFEHFFDLSMDMLCIASADGYFKRVNSSFQRTLGWTPDELTSRPFVEFIHPDDIDATLQEVQKLASGQPTVSFGNRYRCSDGGHRHLQWTAYPEPASGLLFAIARDTTELIEANQRFQLAIDASPAALLIVDERGLIQLVNREAERLFGYSRDLLIGNAVEMLVPAAKRGQHQQDRAAFLRNPEARAMGTGRHLQAVRRDGTVFPAEIALSPVRFGEQVHVLSTIIDLTLQQQVEESMIQLTTELEGANAQLAELSITDKLTGVMNRRALDDQLEKELRLMHRVGRPLSVLMLDIDYFKRYNDRHGHQAGDEILKQIANILKETTRTTDVAARYGGEEFAVVLPNTDKEGAVQMAERFQMAIRAHPWEQHTLTVSMGISTRDFGEEPASRTAGDVTTLLADADRALYFSKHNGRDRATHVSDMPSR